MREYGIKFNGGENMINKKVLYFTASWCGPCKKTRPVVEQMIADGFNIDILDADSEITMINKYYIRSVPTFILLENNIEIDRITGGKNREELQKFIGSEIIE